MAEPILIVGAGVAGLATHIALRQRGIESLLVEAAPAVRKSGGGLWLWTNGVKVLDALGVGRAVREIGTVLRHNEFRTFRGDMLWTLPIGDLSELHGAPSLVVPRAALLDVLESVVRPEAFRFGFTVNQMLAREDGVSLLAKDGARLEGSLVVGADGIHSTLRSHVMGSEPLRAAGEVAWVGLAAFRHRRLPEGVAMATVGHGRLRSWCAGMGDRVCWYGIVGSAETCRSPAELAHLFEDAHEPIAAVMRATKPEDAVVTPTTDRPSRRGWSRDRVVLVGDAAHPTTPDIGQGACQGLESALVLARCIAAHRDSHSRAFEAYETERAPRTGLVNRLAYTTNRAIGASSPFRTKLREGVVMAQLPWGSAHVLDWLLSGGPGVEDSTAV